jgi:hypothetical protein
VTARPPVWVCELAARFWASVPEPPPPFPRDLAAALVWLDHLRHAEVRGLTTATAAAFLRRHGQACSFGGPDRPLRGCLGVDRGAGFILVEAADPPAERRFSLAHELAHFLRDYDEPRRKAAARLGPKVLEALDGRRPPTADERLAGILRSAAVGCHTHLLHRDDRGRPATPAEAEAEEAADRLAFELLAPFEAVAVPAAGPAPLAARLVSDFGLPDSRAADYAALLGEHGSQECVWRLAIN